MSVTNSQQLITVLTEVIDRDYRAAIPVIPYFMTNATLGGSWEGWLQVQYARAVLAALTGGGICDREVNFPGTPQRCDLAFSYARGTTMWVELKVQRRSDYTGTVGDFSADIGKIQHLTTAFRQTNVLVAAAVLRLRGTGEDSRMLDELRTRVAGGTMRYLLYNGPVANPWTDVTEAILTTRTPNASQALVATYRAS